MNYSRFSQFIDWMAHIVNRAVAELEAGFAASGQMLTPCVGVPADQEKPD